MNLSVGNCFYPVLKGYVPMKHTIVLSGLKILIIFKSIQVIIRCSVHCLVTHFPRVPNCDFGLLSEFQDLIFFPCYLVSGLSTNSSLFVCPLLCSVADPGCFSRNPDRDFYPSWIPDPGVKKNLLSYLFFVAMNFTKLKIVLFSNCWRTKFGPIFKEL